jgi:hypothetical protein
VLTGVQAGNAVPDVIGRAGKDRYRFDVLIQNSLFERLVGFIAAIDRHQPGASLWKEIADRFHDAVGMLVPVEVRSKPSADHSDAHFLRASRGTVRL